MQLVLAEDNRLSARGHHGKPCWLPERSGFTRRRNSRKREVRQRPAIPDTHPQAPEIPGRNRNRKAEDIVRQETHDANAEWQKISTTIPQVSQFRNPICTLIIQAGDSRVKLFSPDEAPPGTGWHDGWYPVSRCRAPLFSGYRFRSGDTLYPGQGTRPASVAAQMSIRRSAGIGAVGRTRLCRRPHAPLR